MIVPSDYFGMKVEEHFVWITFALVIILFVSAIDFEQRKKNKENFDNNPKVEGRIEDVRTVKDRRGKTIYADISYLVDGKKYSKSFIYPKATEDMIKQSIVVAYEEDDPENIYVDIYGPTSLTAYLKELDSYVLPFIAIAGGFCVVHLIGRIIYKSLRKKSKEYNKYKWK